MKDTNAKVVLDSISPDGKRITTFQLRYPRFIHSEFLTHRTASRNAGSSRATPISKVLKQVWDNPAMPVHWGINRPGMQAKEELTGFKLTLAKLTWRAAGRTACLFARAAMALGGHKQWVNRMLEPWQYINVVVTATDLRGFFALRCHPDAQPEFQVLANLMRAALAASNPQRVARGEWHIPYIRECEKSLPLSDRLRMSVSRCARVSYEPFDGKGRESDRTLHDKLLNANPMHASPFEHQARSSIIVGDGRRLEYERNFNGWEQYRAYVEHKIM